MSASQFSSEQTIKWLFTTDTMGTRPTTWFVALHTGNPGTDGAANEVADANYARKAVNFAAAALPSNMWQVANDADVVFDAAAAPYDVQYVSVFTSATLGTCLAVMPLAIARAIPSGGVFSIPSGEFTITAHNPE